MCGIAVTLDDAEKGRAVPWALDHMRHRGPDGEGTWSAPDKSASLEHCRLAIIDPDNTSASQPMWDPSNRWVISFNGEIFNYREIRARLQRAGVTFRTESDTEVLLQGFLQKGERILDELVGMFAFAVWDSQTNDLFAARDQLGVKPLYFRTEGGFIILTSELRTMVEHPAVDKKLDVRGVLEYLAFGHASLGRTIVEDVHTLPPGHALRLRGGRLEIFEYWDALPAAMPAPDPATVEDTLLGLLDQAVASSLVSDVPVALMLSGGVDSSAVARLAVDHMNPSDLLTYSVAFGREDDEAGAAARFAADLGIRHRTLGFDQKELAAWFEKWATTMDVPCSNPTWLAVSAIAAAAREDGIKVLIGGDGGDELFGGYTRWMKYLKFHDRVWSPTPSGLRSATGNVIERRSHGLAKDIARRARSGKQLFIGSRPWHEDALWALAGPVAKDVLTGWSPEHGIDTLRSTFDAKAPDADYLTWMSYAATKTHLVEDFLARLDKMGMRESVEGRVPLLDPRLARFAFTIPQDMKVGRYRQKELFKKTVGRLLPDYILNKPKQGFCAPVTSWATQLMAQRKEMDVTPLVDHGIVDRETCQSMLADPKTDAFAKWTLGSLLLWCDATL
jgi:asparagine synthase (glutamine-hydrolysing)